MLLLNYVNPMAANCWAVDRATGRPHIGLCHSVQGTSEMLAGWLGVPYSEVIFRCAGINHQAFFLTFRRGDEDLYPEVRRVTHTPEAFKLSWLNDLPSACSSSSLATESFWQCSATTALTFSRSASARIALRPLPESESVFNPSMPPPQSTSATH